MHYVYCELKKMKKYMWMDGLANNNNNINHDNTTTNNLSLRTNFCQLSSSRLECK